MLTSLAQHLKADHCIMTTNYPDLYTIDTIKELSEKKIFAVYMSSSQLMHFLNPGFWINQIQNGLHQSSRKTVLIWKINLSSLMAQINQVF